MQRLELPSRLRADSFHGHRLFCGYCEANSIRIDSEYSSPFAVYRLLFYCHQCGKRGLYTISELALRSSWSEQGIIEEACKLVLAQYFTPSADDGIDSYWQGLLETDE